MANEYLIDQIQGYIDRIPKIDQNKEYIDMFQKDLDTYVKHAEDNNRENLLGFLKERVKRFLTRSYGPNQ